MPIIQFSGQVPEAPPRETLWQPGEQRDVDQATADYLQHNSQFTLVATVSQEPAPDAAQPAQGG